MAELTAGNKHLSLLQDFVALKQMYKISHIVGYSTRAPPTHTQPFNDPFVLDYPGGPVPEETFTHSHP